MRKIYSWKTWLSKAIISPLTLRRGEDYNCSQGTICQQARNAASRLKQTITIIEGDNYITLINRGEREVENAKAN